MLRKQRICSGSASRSTLAALPRSCGVPPQGSKLPHYDPMPTGWARRAGAVGPCDGENSDFFSELWSDRVHASQPWCRKVPWYSSQDTRRDVERAARETLLLCMPCSADALTRAPRTGQPTRRPTVTTRDSIGRVQQGPTHRSQGTPGRGVRSPARREQVDRIDFSRGGKPRSHGGL